METVDMEQSLKDIEKDHIIAVLNRTHWHLGQACDASRDYTSHASAQTQNVQQRYRNLINYFLCFIL